MEHFVARTKDKRGKHKPGNKTSDEGRGMVKRLIESFPAVADKVRVDSFLMPP